MYNRQQRRQMEKNLGLLKAQERMSDKQLTEIKERRRATGKQIYLQTVQSREQYLQEFETKQYSQRVDFWLKQGHDQEQATAQVDEEYRIENEKFDKNYEKKRKIFNKKYLEVINIKYILLKLKK